MATAMFGAAERMYNVLKNAMPCTCQREFKYSGVGVKMCVRCEAMTQWEIATTGASETEAHFKAKIL